MSKTLYISDLDGTLLNAEATISERSRHIINEAVADGALFSIATARTPATIAPISQGLDLRIPAVVMTGVTLWNRDSDKYSHTHHIKQGIPRRLLEIYRRHNVPTFVYTLANHRINIYHQGMLTDLEKRFMEERMNSPYKKFHVPPHGESQLPDKLSDTVLFYAMYPTEEARKVFEETSLIEEINPLFYHDIFGPEIALLEAFPATASKAVAMRDLAAETGADRIVAFGDNLNDLPMLREADVAVAVGNAVEEVKQTADVVIEANTADAVAKFIKNDFYK